MVRVARIRSFIFCLFQVLDRRKGIGVHGDSGGEWFI